MFRMERDSFQLTLYEGSPSAYIFLIIFYLVTNTVLGTVLGSWGYNLEKTYIQSLLLWGLQSTWEGLCSLFKLSIKLHSEINASGKERWLYESKIQWKWYGLGGQRSFPPKWIRIENWRMNKWEGQGEVQKPCGKNNTHTYCFPQRC